ncbi:ribbon-helix-helix protein, CopG family [Microbacterium foliorum]|uniref:Ribbon-helix-helix protein, copG family n=1 Tax=Microbacterium foliorum TaxID=104336 RepID=A0A0F0KYW4_9MICO|nr:ribbon-helix-helix protein, CopG family [Microbacterium foliorum]AXL13492.1 ribbon-helix-helix protein, CopG family [Microbacterium foliorum]KJL25649.1 Ribbon-helix-helix protein, copG family [Microbacterium foliorum]
MAMTVRLPEELDAQLEEIARARHISKHAVLIEAATRFANSESKTERVLSIADEVGERYADALTRLEDA